MSDITQRKMQAEADANTHIGDKDFKHTSAYKIIADGIDPEVTSQITLNSGQAVHQQLLRRAKAKALGMNLSYDSSGLGAGLYRREAFDSYDQEKRDRLLGKTDSVEERKKKKRKAQHHHGYQDDDDEEQKGYKSPYQPDKKSEDGNNANNNTSINLTEKARERFGSTEKPTRYNPYA